MLFTLAVDQSAPSLPSVMLTPTAQIHVSKCSWFPSLSSCRRRNFLEKRFTFLATRELLVQLKPGCFALSSAPLSSNLLLTINSLAGRGGRWRLELWMAHLFEICSTARAPQWAGCAECSCWIPHKGKKGLFPPDWTSECEKGQILVWVDTGGVSVSEELRLPDLTNEARKVSSDTGRILSK